MNEKYTIILDASHGGEDFGNSHEGFHEKDYTLYIINYLQKALEDTNLTILTTRTSDETIQPFDRVTKIKNMITDKDRTIILSIHAHFDEPNTLIVYSMYDKTNLATEIYNMLKEGKLNVSLPITKILPADWEKDYHFIHRELNHHPTVILDCFFDINDPEDHCGLFSYLIVEAILKHIQQKEERSSYTIKKGDSLYSIASLNNTTVDEIKSLNNLSSNLLSIGQIIELPDLYETKDYFLYTVKPNDNLYAIARKYNTTVDTIKKLNHLTSTNLAIQQVLKIPLMEKEETSISIPTYTNYTVKKGDSLYSIAKAFHTTVNAIMKDNSLGTTTLSIGQILKIETQKEEPVTQEACYGDPEKIEELEDINSENKISYTVQKGDSLYLISKKFNTTVGEIIQENNLKSTTLSIGQTLTIPTSNTNSNTLTYTVQKNDSLYSISKKFNTTVTKIKELNHLTSNLLSIGQQLTIERTV